MLRLYSAFRYIIPHGCDFFILFQLFFCVPDLASYRFRRSAVVIFPSCDARFNRNRVLDILFKKRREGFEFFQRQVGQYFLVFDAVMHCLSDHFMGLTEGQPFFRQIVRHILVPQASRGILGGIMLAMGRAAEDTAVILLTGVVANAGLPSGLAVRFEALPFFIYYTAAQYQTPEELERGFGASLTLLLLSGGLLLAAWWLHARYQRRKDACSLREGVSA